jgi:imidazole glycerol phosphate synthase subunit HisF
MSDAMVCLWCCCRSGADKVSIGSDAVLAAEEYYAAGCVTNGSTAIEQISEVYGKQAVVVSTARMLVADLAAGHLGAVCIEQPAELLSYRRLKCSRSVASNQYIVLRGWCCEVACLAAVG